MKTICSTPWNLLTSKLFKTLSQLLDLLVNFKNIHPIRFWGLIAFGFLFIISLIVILKKQRVPKIKRSNKRKQKKTWVPIAVILLIFGIIGIGAVYLYVFKKGNNAVISLSEGENIHITASKKNFGIDISHYQGVIDWEELKTSEHCINYIFVRATMGSDGKDQHFENNWKRSKENGYLRGAYHYYRPNENSVEQFKNFSKVVELESGDFPPVLDIEEMGKYGTENLVAGILNWLRLAEGHYGVIPIVYTGGNFYQLYLKGRIDAYPLWIAAYSGSHGIRTVDWKFHQFSDRIRIKGIAAFVDGNSFNGEIEELLELRIAP